MERVIGRMKDFESFHGVFPLSILDLSGQNAQVCAALGNLNGPTVSQS